MIQPPSTGLQTRNKKKASDINIVNVSKQNYSISSAGDNNKSLLDADQQEQRELIDQLGAALG